MTAADPKSTTFFAQLAIRDGAPLACLDDTTQTLIKESIAQAVRDGDQVEAKELWKCLTIARVQRQFIDAFAAMKEGRFYDAWCLYERCEIEAGFLLKHYSVADGDVHAIDYIQAMTSRWQSLYPYKLFFSPEFVAKKVTCSICKTPIKPRSSCEHVVGEIYNGEQCCRHVEEVEWLGMSAVENPVQKYSVAFTTDESGNKVDHYNYSNVKWVVDRLVSPFHGWDVATTTRTIPGEAAAHLDRGHICPCKSGKTFGECCSGKDEITIPHMQVGFAVHPPAELPNLELLL